MEIPISITAFSSISALGSGTNDIWNAYLNDKTYISTTKFNNNDTFVAQLSEEDKQEIERLKQSDNKYKNLDESVLYAIFASRKATEQAKWKASDNFGVNFGSSRGATKLFEKYHSEFLKDGVSSTLSSPTTTLGNISSWVAHDLQTKGVEISHSITCSTALHSLLNGVAWLKSGLANKFLVGGSEASLTDFTIAQMKALRVYASSEFGVQSSELNSKLKTQNSELVKYPCRAFDLEKTQNTMVLGEGASAVCLEVGKPKNAIAQILGIGFATEVLKHNTSVTADAECFQKSMKMALGELNPLEVDVIVMHCPGTKRGDSSEVNAIKKVFGEKTPFLTTNKWKLGHTFGTSGLLSLEFGLLMLQHQKAIAVPYAKPQEKPQKIKKVLVNAVGFGGNAVSVLIGKD